MREMRENGTDRPTLHGQCVDLLRAATCPDCRRPFSRDAPPPINISLSHVIDALVQDAGEDAIFLCGRHDKALKAYFCLQCRVECCSDCVIGGEHREHVKSVKRIERLPGVEVNKINEEARSLILMMCDLDEKMRVKFLWLLDLVAFAPDSFL